MSTDILKPVSQLLLKMIVVPVIRKNKARQTLFNLQL